MKRILFQGDSITDARRDREDFSNLGIGYPTLVKAELGFENPEVFDFQNRGISGNRIVLLFSMLFHDAFNDLLFLCVFHLTVVFVGYGIGVFLIKTNTPIFEKL